MLLHFVVERLSGVEVVVKSTQDVGLIGSEGADSSVLLFVQVSKFYFLIRLQPKRLV